MTTARSAIELWLVDCDRCAPALQLIERDLPRLTLDDRARAQAIKDRRERSRRLAAYTALRLLIERVAGPAVRGQPFVRVAGSKPTLAGGGAEFNLSHTDAHALIAVSRGLPLGVDIEKLRQAKMSARRLAEIVALGTGLGDKPLPRLDGERALLQAWARLEAFAKELAVRLPDESIWHAIAFHICVFIWAFECWFWARVLLQLLFSHDRERHVDGQMLSHWQRKCVEHVPRILALLAYAVPVLALIAARTFLHAVIAALAGILFYTVLVLRRWAAKKVREHTTNEKVRKFIDAQGQPYARLRDLPAAWMWILIGGVILGAMCTAFVVIDPVTFGWTLGAAAVPFIGFALIVPIGSLAVYLSHLLVARDRPRANRSLPAVTIMVVWAVVGGLLADNHILRTVPNSTPRRTPFDKAVRDWHVSAKTASGQEEPPLVIVSAAGGGLRAAYWTATVLGALQDADSNFGKYVFAISGVSGGSLGATVFVTLLGQPVALVPTTKDCPLLEGKRLSVECAGQQVLAQDFPAPAAAGLLFPDLLHNFLPVFGTGHDRAAALEKGWERAWERAGFDSGIWAKRSFTQLWPDAKTPLPALLLNGVHVATGKRIITSNLSTVDIPIADAYDVFEDMLKVDIPVSTAAHNSARFTYVSPAGTLLEQGSGVNHGRIVDGGYFENLALPRRAKRCAP